MVGTVMLLADHVLSRHDGTRAMQITWYGHSAFRLDFAGKAVLIDPFFTGNPAFVSDKAAATKGVTHIVLTHGHADHVGDALDISQSTGAPVVTNYDLCMWLAGKGLQKFDPMNTGGTTDQGGFKAPGEPTVYHMGDTDVFGDMALIAELYQPKIAMVPIGDRFTMSPSSAAFAVKRFFKLDAVIPCHYGSFPIIAPTADAFVAEMKGHATKVIVPEKGKAVRVP
jgi:L-ascorbate metabolism protein UlaG (beta-lactamase superfamily)